MMLVGDSRIRQPPEETLEVAGLRCRRIEGAAGLLHTRWRCRRIEGIPAPQPLATAHAFRARESWRQALSGKHAISTCHASRGQPDGDGGFDHDEPRSAPHLQAHTSSDSTWSKPRSAPHLRDAHRRFSDRPHHQRPAASQATDSTPLERLSESWRLASQSTRIGAFRTDPSTTRQTGARRGPAPPGGVTRTRRVAKHRGPGRPGQRHADPGPARVRRPAGPGRMRGGPGQAACWLRSAMTRFMISKPCLRSARALCVCLCARARMFCA